MNHKTIKRLQEAYGYSELQSLINSGEGWKFEGSYGRAMMDGLKSGMCMLPKVAHYDYYENRIPSRDELKKGTQGTYQNCLRFWQGVEDGSIYLETEDHEIQ